MLLLIPWPAWSARPLVVAPGDSLVIEGRTLKGGRHGPILDCRGVAVLRDCNLIGRGGRQPLLTVRGPQAQLRVENCLLRGGGKQGWTDGAQASDSSSNTPSSTSPPSPLISPLISLQGGRLDLVSSTLAAAAGQMHLELSAGATARLNSSLLAGGGGRTPVWVAGDSSAVSLGWCLTDRQAWAEAAVPPGQAPGGVLAVEPRFVNAAGGDFRLRWDSPALDRGDPALPLDFDLTRADMGWTPQVAEETLSGTVTAALKPRHYRVVDDTILSSDLPAGAVLRVETGKTLLLTPGGGSGLQIGNGHGPRTAIVGRPASDADPAKMIAIQNWTNDELSHLVMEGVLFNYAPKDGDDTDVSLHGWTPNWCAGPQVDGEKLQFKNYKDASFSGGTYSGGLKLSTCTGAVRNLDFGSVAGPAWLKLSQCNTSVEHNTFVPQDGAPCLQVISTMTGQTQTLRDNQFTGAGSQAAPLLEVHNAVVDLRRNQFLDCRNTPLAMLHSTVHADSEARNDWRAGNGFESDQPMATMEGGFLDLYCGRNNFIASDYGVGWPVITWVPDSLPSPPQVNWRENFWGTSCQDAISETDLIDPNLALLPRWAHTEDNLSQCVDVLTPANPACPFEPYTPLELLNSGKVAELAEDYESAQDNYRFLLWLHAASKEANEGTLRLKALGLHKTHGPEAYESVREDLFAAADSSKGVKLFHQAMLQVCSAWCVEARWGYRPAAVDSLNGLFARERDKLNKDTIYLALLEIATYPLPGGLLAMDPELQIAQAVVHQAAVEELFRFKSGQWPQSTDEIEVPRRFEISNLYPNPFNARTTIEVALPMDGHLRLRVFNLLGQLVATPYEGEVIAGRQRVVLDASSWASGIYLVAAEHGGGVQVRKMTLIK